MKKCSKCKVEKEVSNFWNNKNRKDGKQNVCKECLTEYTKSDKWKENRRYYIRKYQKNREECDIRFKLSRILRRRLHQAIQRNSKTGSAVKDLGCNLLFFKKYIESKFIEGMTWENYGEWHIDHIKPLSKFNLCVRDELVEAVNYKNMQPLWAIDNQIKYNN